MALLTESEARSAGQNARSRVNKSAASILTETASTGVRAFDIFLSHSRLDADVVLGVKLILEGRGRTVYVDWVDDPHLDRMNVSPATAEKLRARMKQSNSLFYLHSGNSTKSRWMPWELGYFDGFRGNVAIMPLATQSNQNSYVGEEFLGLYPYVDITSGNIYIHKGISVYKTFAEWTLGTDKLRPAA